ncbi:MULTISPECIES: hypothetical protein [unclassified Mesorhizobium]|nr:MULTISPECIES: hypothetical protein [unclassified Mesorhizobium]
MIAPSISDGERFDELKHGFAKLFRRYRSGGFDEGRTIACVWCRLHES